MWLFLFIVLFACGWLEEETVLLPHILSFGLLKFWGCVIRIDENLLLVCGCPLGPAALDTRSEDWNKSIVAAVSARTQPMEGAS